MGHALIVTMFWRIKLYKLGREFPKHRLELKVEIYVQLRLVRFCLSAANDTPICPLHEKKLIRRVGPQTL